MVESWYDKKERCRKISIFYKIARNCAILKKEKPEGGNDMEQFNILVCDDDKSIVDAIEIYLKQEGYNVIKAYNGLEALQALEKNEVHLILLDIMMPQMDGLQATVRIRETLNIPIIILSAKSEDTDKINGLDLGADDYVTKPFSPSELLARVDSLYRRVALAQSHAENNFKEEFETSILSDGSIPLFLIICFSLLSFDSA